MTSDRAYRESISAEDAAKELERCASSQFDPEVVRTFLAVLTAERAATVKA